MDPIGALIIAALVAWGGVSGWFGDVKSRLTGNGRPNHERRMQERAQQHERRMQADRLRHEARMAGKAGPTIQESTAERIRRGRKPYTEMGPLRRWWYDLCADRVEQLTRERREREERRRRGEQEWQKFGRWSRARWEQAKDRAEQRWRDRHATQDPDGRPWVDSERVDRDGDWPDPNTPDPGVVDADVVDDPPPAEPEPPREIEPPFPEWDTKRDNQDPQPATGGAEEPAGWAGRGPTQPGATPDPIRATAERIDPHEHDTPPAPIKAIAERIPEITGGTVAEIFNPESAIADATMLETEAGGLIGTLDQRIGDLDANNVTGVPRDAYAGMQEAATLLRDRAAEAVAAFQNHAAIQDHVKSDESVGNGRYLEID